MTKPLAEKQFNPYDPMMDGHGNWQRPVPEIRENGTPKEVMIISVAEHCHAERWLDAGHSLQAYMRSLGRDYAKYVGPTTKEKVQEELVRIVNWALNNERYDLAARVLWPLTMFDPRPYFTRMVWDTLRCSNSLMLMGSASASKSFSTGVWLMLDWLRDPENTNVKLLGPSEQHLQDNLFSHMVNLHQNAIYPLPGVVKELFIGLDGQNKYGCIRGVVVPLGKKAAGRLQGAKPGRRKKEHPVFGVERRMRVFMDESEKIPPGIWKDVGNIVANMVGLEKFKIMCAFNPENQNGESGTRCEPQEGWPNGFDIDKSERWRSKRGWDVVRLDGYKGENVVLKKTIYPGLQTWEGICKVTEDCGGHGSAGWYTMARAAFPPTGSTLTIIPQGMCESARGQFVFVGTPQPVAGCDLALEGGDSAYFAFGSFGLASGYRTSPSILYPKGNYVEFKNKEGQVIPRPALQLEQILRLDSGDTIAVAAQVADMAKKLSVPAERLCVDRTGHGAGVGDLLKNLFGNLIQVNYSESSTKTRILEEDTQTCDEAYERMYSELWFALRKWLEHDLVKISPNVETPELFDQLTDRRYITGKRLKVESKKEYKLRSGGKSPDRADTFTLFVNACRKAFGVTPSLKKDVAGTLPDDYDGPDAGNRVDYFNDMSDDWN